MCVKVRQVFCLAFTLLYANTREACGSNWFPTPTLTAYDPRGLQISVPGVDGVNVVVLYVSINKNLESNDDVQYIEHARKEIDDRWIIHKDSIKVNVGDVVYFKIYVERNRRGYFYNGTPYLITERVKRPSSSHQTSQTTTTIPASPQTKSNLVPTLSPTDCTLSLHTALRALGDAQKELEVLRADQEILKDLASKQPFQLHLSGLVTEIGEPKDIIKFVLLEKLDLKVPVHNVVKSGTTITFQVTTFEEKLNILKRAKENLKDSPNILISPA